MKPAPFRYVAPRTLDEALAFLAEHAPEAKVLAGGQSLVPMMNFRIARPAWLVDLNRIPGLSGIEAVNGELVIGSMTRQADVETSTVVCELAPLLHEAVPFVGHWAVRNRGTVGGSLAHADPAAELPLVMLALDATVHVASEAGVRQIPVGGFFVSLFTTALAADEIITSVRLRPLGTTTGSAFLEFARRDGDFALAAVAVTLRLQQGVIAEPVRIALGGVADRPIRAPQAEAVLRGAAPTATVFQNAGARAASEAAPPSDIHGSADYRRHLIAVLVPDALERAAARAGGKTGLAEVRRGRSR